MTLAPRATAREVAPLDLTGVDDVVVCAPDGHGRLMGKTVTAADWPVISRDGLSMPDFHLATDVTNTIQDGLRVTGSHTGFPNGLLLPDPATAHELPWLPGTALVLADVADAAGRLVAEAPRQVLRRQTERLREHGLAASVATELELYVFQEDPEVAAARSFSGLTPLAQRQGDHDVLVAEQYEPYLGALRLVMRQLGTPVLSSLAEGGVGQLEVNFDHGPPLAVADTHVLFKYVCKSLAARQGRSVTFMAKWHHEQPGSSGHVHLSLRDEGTGEPLLARADDPAALHPRGRAFLAGVLRHAPDFALLHAPYANSYRRLRAAHWVPSSTTWGVDDRRTMVRLLGHGDSGRLEFRYPGADMNPYLSLAGVLAAGLAGLEADLPLPDALSPANPDAAPLPVDLRDAVERFEASPVAAAALGDAVRDHYAARGRHELAQTEVLVADWERARAFDRV